MRRDDPAELLIRIYRELSTAVSRLSFGLPVTHVYNPLDYARAPVERYLRLAARSAPEALFLGMNPGPWGMAQTGVPFGSAPLVRDWIGIEGKVGKPELEHPRRPVDGFAVKREEVSGNRFWGWARDRFGTADRFFSRFFVANYCPLVFMESSGRNRTPDKLPAAEQSALFEPCDQALRDIVDTLRPRQLVAVGAFAEKRAKAALVGQDIPVGRVLHPSPASPVANRGWAEQAEQQLRRLGIAL